MAHIISKKELLLELYLAEEIARKHKTKKKYVIEFEKNLHKNLMELCDELYNHTYKPGRYYCFIIKEPKKREIFAARYRDRIVHHLYYNLTYRLYERTFIYDSYSCIKNRGTHFGIDRLCGHIRKASKNYTEECHILKMDIKGYFMHIDRNLLFNVATTSLQNERYKRISKNSQRTWDDVLDFDFITYLTKELVLFDPTTNCIFKSKKDEWEDLPYSKSLFHSPQGYGIPIGNLTSQLFSNVFLNLLDQFCKRSLNCKHYGRYVDDFYVVSADKNFLHSLIPQIEHFLEYDMHLETNKGKTKITSYKQGVEFLGTFIKPYRNYISNKTMKRMQNNISDNEKNSWKNGRDIEMSVNSYLGIFGHNASYNVRKEMFDKAKVLNQIGIFNGNYTKFYRTDSI